jgi:exonuclease III
VLVVNVYEKFGLWYPVRILNHFKLFERFSETITPNPFTVYIMALYENLFGCKPSEVSLTPLGGQAASLFFPWSSMNNSRQFNVLVWNIRGLNSQAKWDAIRTKIDESSCQILCLQETKRESFNNLYLKKFCPKHLNCFAFSPSIGAPGGIITIWNGKFFDGSVVHSNGYCVTIKFLNKMDNSVFHLTNVYGPSQSDAKMAFITWLLNVDTDELDDWILAGDFNLYRSTDNRKKPGGDTNEMQLFNDLISALDLVELPFNGRTFTWSNMQADPLLIKLDWVFCSPSWSWAHPSTKIQPLDRPISDHIPFVITFGSTIPKSNIFRFEITGLNIQTF